MPTKQQDDLLVDFDQQRKNKKSVVIRTYEKKKGIIKIKVRSKSVWFASVSFPRCLQVHVVSEILSSDFQIGFETFTSLNITKEGAIECACGGLNSRQK